MIIMKIYWYYNIAQPYYVISEILRFECINEKTLFSNKSTAWPFIYLFIGNCIQL